MDITIKDKTYKVKYTLRALFIYEKITGQIFSINNIMDQFLFYYCLIIANNQDAELTLDQFIDACDEDGTIAAKMSDFLLKENDKQNTLEEVKSKGSKKKVKHK